MSLVCEATSRSERLGMLKVTSGLVEEIKNGQKIEPFLLAQLESKALCKLPKNLEVNLGSLSETMLDGTSCNLTISLTYRLVNLSKRYPMLTGIK